MVKEKDDLDKPILADSITDRLGSGRFIIAQTAFLIIYLIWNTQLPQTWRFDGEPFILLNLMLSFQAAYTGPVVLWSQNRAAKRDRALAEKTNHMMAQALRLEKKQDKHMQEVDTRLRHIEDLLRARSE